MPSNYKRKIYTPFEVIRGVNETTNYGNDLECNSVSVNSPKITLIDECCDNFELQRVYLTDTCCENVVSEECKECIKGITANLIKDSHYKIVINSECDIEDVSSEWVENVGGEVKIDDSKKSVLIKYSNIGCGDLETFTITVCGGVTISKQINVLANELGEIDLSNPNEPLGYLNVFAGDNEELFLDLNSNTTSFIVNSASVDSDSSIVSYNWEIFDGEGSSILNGDTLNASFNNLTKGNYKFKLTVRNEKGLECYSLISVNVRYPDIEVVNKIIKEEPCIGYQLYQTNYDNYDDVTGLDYSYTKTLSSYSLGSGVILDLNGHNNGGYRYKVEVVSIGSAVESVLFYSSSNSYEYLTLSNIATYDIPKVNSNFRQLDFCFTPIFKEESINKDEQITDLNNDLSKTTFTVRISILRNDGSVIEDIDITPTAVQIGE